MSNQIPLLVDDEKDIDRLLPEIVEAVVHEVDPEQIYLFGSRARGGARKDSDFDLLIIERGSFGKGRSRFNEINRIYQALSRFRIPEDVLVYSSVEKSLKAWLSLLGAAYPRIHLLHILNQLS